jgi:hypothetical protein
VVASARGGEGAAGEIGALRIAEGEGRAGAEVGRASTIGGERGGRRERGDGGVALVDAALSEGATEQAPGAWIAGEGDHARGGAIEAVDGAGFARIVGGVAALGEALDHLIGEGRGLIGGEAVGGRGQRV